jgi:hypothetical protein
MPNLKNPEERLWASNDSVFDVNYNASGKIGVGFEFGRFHVIKKSRLISHVELLMGLKVFRGVERFTAVLDEPDRPEVYQLQGDGTFNHAYATMSFVATNSKQLGRDLFLENSLGINGDYQVGGNQRYNRAGLPIELNDLSRFVFQAHYRLGFGFKISRQLLIVPTLETPIVTFYEYDDLKSTLHVFNSRYRPFIFRVRIFMMDKKAGRKCPTKAPKRKGSESLFGMSDSNQPW